MADELRLKGLFRRGLAGDQAAYQAFLSELGGLLERQLCRQLGRMGQFEGHAEDIVQEVLIAVHTKRHTYDWETPVTAWARAIARYKLIDLMRARTQIAADVPFDESLHTVVADGAAVETASAVQSVLRSLPEKLRRPIELMKVGGYSSAETAQMTDMSEAAVKVNVHRGLKALARMWR